MKQMLLLMELNFLKFPIVSETSSKGLFVNHHSLNFNQSDPHTLVILFIFSYFSNVLIGHNVNLVANELQGGGGGINFNSRLPEVQL